MRIKINRNIAFLFLVLLPTSLMLRSSAGAADASAQLAAKLYEGAKKEGKLVIYGLGEPFLTPIATAFKKRYAGITIEAFDEPGAQSRERVIAEQKTGRLIGDIIIAEPKAMIGFTGARVIEQTLKKKLPDGFQESEFLLRHGQIDMVVERKNMRQTLDKLLGFLTREPLATRTGKVEPPVLINMPPALAAMPPPELERRAQNGSHKRNGRAGGAGKRRRS